MTFRESGFYERIGLGVKRDLSMGRYYQLLDLTAYQPDAIFSSTQIQVCCDWATG